MELWIWAFIGGLAGTFCMDLGARRFASIGVNDALGGLLGRWVIGFAKFKFVIDGNRELTTPESPLESRLGTMFHYIIGGGGVALIYPTWFSFSGTTLPENHILPGLIFGILSVALTWFVQYPCFGFGVLGRNGPQRSHTILPPICLHSLYGLVIGTVLQLGL